jgi:hypothetical protein
MSYNFVLNASNNVSIYNNTFKYNFVNGQFDIPEGSEMCINTLVLPYSWYNVSSFIGNNTFYWTYPVPTSSFTINATSSSTITVSSLTGTANLGVGSIITCSSNPTSTSPNGLIYITALGTGTGGNGTYVINQSATYSGASATSTGVVRTITLTDGFYQLSDINNALWADMKTATVYYYNTNPNMITGFTAGTESTNIIYPISFSSNPNGYNNVVSFQYIPTVSTDVPKLFGTNYAYQFGSYPATTSTCQIIIPTGVTNSTTNNIGNLLGFTSGAYPSTPTTKTFTTPATLTNSFPLPSIGGNSLTAYTPPFPAIGSAVNGVIIRCSLVDNAISTVNDILNSTPINSTFGSNIIFNPLIDSFVKIKKGTYSSLTITFSDQNFNTLYMNDPNILLSLMIRFPKK